MTKAFVVFAMLAMVLSACGDWGQGSENGDLDGEPIPFRMDGELTFLRDGSENVTIEIEIAESDSARERGLMQRDSLPDLGGMLFIFPREETQSFWMANTPLALDLIFVDSDSQIVDIDKYTRPFSTGSIASDAPAQYVIEVKAGFSDTHGITEGDRVRWRRTEAA